MSSGLVAWLACVGLASPDVRAWLKAWPPPCRAFDPDDPSWSARALITCSENRRQRLPPVPFYLYEAERLLSRGGKRKGVTAEEEVELASACLNRTRVDGAWLSVREHPYTADFFFLQQLLTHPWRVRSADEALLLVPPVMLSTALALGTGAAPMCRAYSARRALHVLNAVTSHRLFRRRRADHLFTAPLWRHTAHANLRPPAGTLWAWYHALVEPMLPPTGSTAQYTLVPVPQNLPDLGIPAARALTARRPLAAFFGGGASNKTAGWPQGGYGAVRLPLFLAALPGAENATSAGVGPDGGVLLVHTAPRRGTDARYEATPLTRALPPCAPDWKTLAKAAAQAARRVHACTGGVALAELGLRARAMLYLRGDRPTTRRFQDCAATGAVPVVVSDGLHRSGGVAFEALVPYHTFSVQLRERALRAEPLVALRRVLERQLHGARLRRSRQLLLHFRRDLLWQYQESESGAWPRQHGCQPGARAARPGAAGGAAPGGGGAAAGCGVVRSRVAENVLLSAALALAQPPPINAHGGMRAPWSSYDASAETLGSAAKGAAVARLHDRPRRHGPPRAGSSDDDTLPSASRSAATA